MSLKLDSRVKEYLEFENLFNKLGLEIIGTKNVNNEEIYLVKKKSR